MTEWGVKPVRFTEPTRSNPPRFGLVGRGSLLLAAMTMLAVFCAWLVAGNAGIFLAIGIVVATLIYGQRLSPRAIMRLHRAVPLPAWRLPAVHAGLATLARRAGLGRAPEVYRLRRDDIAAFTVGNGDRSAIAVSDGALRHLPPRELGAVLAHEVAHVAAGDTAWMTLADVIARTTTSISLVGVVSGLILAMISGEIAIPLWAVMLLALAPMATGLLMSAFSREREFAADLAAARLTRDPAGLAAALARIEAATQGAWHVFLRSTRRRVAPSMLRSHPSTQDRIRRLLQLTAGAPGH